MSKKEKSGASKTNVTGRAKAEKPRDVELVIENYVKANGALGLRRYWRDAK